MIQHFGFAVLRHPLNSYQDAYSMPAENELFDECLWLASSEFFREFSKNRNVSDLDPKTSRSLWKYWIRSCMRCTPYGTFAGTAMLKVGDASGQILVDPVSDWSRNTRLDMEVVEHLVNKISQDPALTSKLKYFPNNSVYLVGGQLRYAGWEMRKGMRTYDLYSIEYDEVLSAVLNSSAAGATHPQLVRLICDSGNIGAEEAAAFVDELISCQILISDLNPPVTGYAPLQYISGKLAGYDPANQLLPQLKQLGVVLEDKSFDMTKYGRVQKLLESIDHRIGENKNLVQVDVKSDPVNASLPGQCLDEISDAVTDLLVLSRDGKNQSLEKFKQEFQERYENAEIPLMHALDPDAGIGYGNNRDDLAGESQYIEDIVAAMPNMRPPLDISRVEEFVILKYSDFLREKSDKIIIRKEELRAFFGDPARVEITSSSLYLLGSLYRSANDTETDSDHVFDLATLSGPSGAVLLGRFLFDNEDLHKEVKKILEHDRMSNPDVLYAEIAHLPQARAGNVILRPVLSTYEIPYVGDSGAAAAHKLLVSDLLVSVRNGKVILRSKTLNKQIMPSLSCAHNYIHGALPLYNFLGDIQNQYAKSYARWDWSVFSAYKYLPRVQYRNIILKRAIWNVHYGDVFSGKNRSDDDITQWKKIADIPDRVLLVQSDNQLLIDLTRIEGRQILDQYLTKYKKIILEECLADTYDACVSGKDDRPYANELVIPLKVGKPSPTPSYAGGTQVSGLQRTFYPGSNWGFLKVYCGSKSAEKVLLNHLMPFMNAPENQRICEKLFFIRYFDTSHHLRIRFHCQEPESVTLLQTRLLAELQPAIDSKLVHRIALDTYERELERYGGNSIDEVETLFSADSVCALNIISVLGAVEEADKFRIFSALRLIDALLADFGILYTRRIGMLQSIRDNWLTTFNQSAAMLKPLNEKYRALKKDIFTYLDERNDRESGFDEITKFIRQRSVANTLPVSVLLVKYQGLSAELAGVVGSIIHMSVNRLFIAQQLKYELLCCHFLAKYYESLVAIRNR